jgi:raffinose/stachyose/melibiose transport system substrate-binding protein
MERRLARVGEQLMPRAVSRKDFLRFGGVGLAGAVLLGAAGCGRGPSEVVNFLDETTETTALERSVQDIVHGFENQNPNIDVQREAMTTEDIRTVIKTSLQSEQPPDVFSYDTGPGFGGILADAGLLRPMESAYKENGWDIYDWAKQGVTYNGTVYGVPDRLDEIIVYYNRSLFKRLGVEEPKTVDDLRGIAGELKGRGIIPLSFGNREQWPAGHLFSIGASNSLGREGLDDILYGDGRWDTPQVGEAIDLIFRDFVESGYYPKSPNATTYDGANTLFYSGEAAMLPTGTWLVSEIVQAVQDFEVGFFPFPSIGGSGISPPVGVGAGLFVAADAKNPEGAIKFIDYLQQDDTARIDIEKFNTIPAHPVDTEGLDVPELFKQVLDDLSESPQAGAFGYNIDILAPQNFNQAMYTGFQEVLNGTRSPEEQAGALQQAWGEAKKAGNVLTQE